MKKLAFFILFICVVPSADAQNAQTVWDSIKNATLPIVLPDFENHYDRPYRQPLADYGWEDGLQISPDGLNLYALYSPMDFVSWQSFFASNSQLSICTLFENTAFIKPYAGTYGMDLITNGFGCERFPNIDIVYAHRNSVAESFESWGLSGIARAGALEGGPAPLFSETDPNDVDLFAFTGAGDIWIIKNTTANPGGINNAIRLPSPINPVNDEFTADNAFLDRIDENTIILLYEKYSDPDVRTFMYSLSSDAGDTWSNPGAITTINNTLGHIEHPSLHRDRLNRWWLYFSIDYTYIARAKQIIAGNWDSWGTVENILSKGNAVSIGEPTVTRSGDISFSLAYINTVLGDTTDVYDLDPWFMPARLITGTPNDWAEQHSMRLSIYPNPFSASTTITFDGYLQDATLVVYNLIGQPVKEINHIFGAGITLQRDALSPGIYLILLLHNNRTYMNKILVEDR